jgi:hypothetical protein
MHEPTTPQETPEQPAGTAATDPEAAATQRSFVEYLTDPSARRIEWIALGLILVVGVFALFVARGDLLAQTAPLAGGPEAEDEAVADEPAGRDLPSVPYRLVDLELHPDNVHSRYFSGAFFRDPERSTGDEASAGGALEDFRTQLDIYRRRAAEDDNFTIRVYDNRTWRTLEVFVLRELQERYEESGEANWDRVDALRRAAANQLTSKWVARGIPRDNIAMRWGRYNQMVEAREREASYIEYEIRYARQLGLSLLTTEIGTVETFNQDWLVSPAGARGRYQMMPDILDLFGLRTFNLPARAGTVTVREELHPLLGLLGSFQLVRGYANSVGHEIPGVSAYHTGPGNIFTVYQNYLRANANDPNVHTSSVTDAYMWGVTTGFERVWRQSSFGPASRGYVLSAYGALRAVEEKPIDPTKTLFTERVQLSAGSTVELSELLELLEPHGARLNWGYGVDHDNLYERFRQLNSHIALPQSGTPDALAVPDAGNVRLSAAVGGSPVRFFLPYGATDLLERIRPGLLDASRTFRFDDDTFADPAATGEKTQWDYAYDELVMDIGRFGFTQRNQDRLVGLYRHFERLLAENPTQYRDAQMRIIRIHRRVWQTRGFRDLAGTVANVIQRPDADAVAAQ